MVRLRYHGFPLVAGVALIFGAATLARPVQADEAGAFHLTQRSRSVRDNGNIDVLHKSVTWDPKKTAVIVCDMWDQHHCPNAVERVGELAPRMNQLLEKARSRGALVIHAPSSCMEPYKDHPARKRAQAAPKAFTTMPAGAAPAIEISDPGSVSTAPRSASRATDPPG